MKSNTKSQLDRPIHLPKPTKLFIPKTVRCIYADILISLPHLKMWEEEENENEVRSMWRSAHQLPTESSNNNVYAYSPPTKDFVLKAASHTCEYSEILTTP